MASIYDPLGLATPFLLVAKVIVQRLWSLHLDWDEPVAGDELELWKKWKMELEKLQELRVPRCYVSGRSPAVERQLHVFGDASEAAFGSVAYLRTKSANGKITCTLVMSRTRVAPLRKLSIVRLELQAAVLAVRLADTATRELSLPIRVVLKRVKILELENVEVLPRGSVTGYEKILL